MKKNLNEIIEYLSEIHRRDDVYDEEECDLAERVARYHYFELEDISVDEIEIHWNYDEDTVSEYMEYTTNPPPIVIESDKNTIIDGTHRVMAAKNKGIKTIQAYVGKY